MEKKLTKKDYFKKIMEVCADSPEIVAFCMHEVELLEKKNSSKGMSKTQKENELIKEQVVKALGEVGKAVTISELQEVNETMAQYSNQKLSALLKQLVEVDKLVVKTSEKKKSFFSLV